MVKLLIKIAFKMTQKSPSSDKVVKILKWIAYFATAIASFITGAQLQVITIKNRSNARLTSD